jgi:hypothetical protein
VFNLKLNTVVAVTALAVAVLGATPLGHAAGRLILPKGSVGAAQLKKNAVTGLKVKDGSLMAADFGPGQLPAGQPGAKGDPGAPGPKGDKGDPATKLFVEVYFDGGWSLNPSDASVSKFGTGSYRVTFNQDIEACVYFAATNYNRDSFAYASQWAQDTANSVTVNTYALSAGKLNAKDLTFQLAVLC